MAEAAQAADDSLSQTFDKAKNVVFDQVKSAFSSPKRLAIAGVFCAAAIAGGGVTAGVMAMDPTNYAAVAFGPN